MRRREFIKTISSAAAVWPLAARAQQTDQVRRIGVLLNVADDREGQTRFAVFKQALQQLGWVDGRNARIDIRWGANDVERDRKYATELAALAPDVLVASGTLSVAALQQVTRTLSIVFLNVSDPVGAGFVDSLARPGGNVTGFMLLEYSSSG
jgi:putative ABC transport system substrate-binding protein